MLQYEARCEGMAAPAVRSKDSVNRRIDEIGWGLFFLVTGALLLVPERLPDGAWFIAVGLILLGTNAVRRIYDIPASVFITILGALALSAGIGDAFGIRLPLFAVLFILLGIAVIVKPR